jgi:hypothetical protein
LLAKFNSIYKCIKIELNESEYIDKLIDQYKHPSENMSKQSILYALSTNFSTKKSNIIAAYKPYMSSKVIISNPNEKANISFITELVTSSRYALSSDSIQEVRLNSENTSVITSTRSGTNMYSDLTSVLQILLK